MQVIETLEKEITEKRVGANVRLSAPLISVIIPAYNVAEFIESTLDSALSQTFTDFEIILVNDGSPDTEELEKILAPFYEDIIYIKQENGGTAAARNTAIRAARGEWLAFLDGDDIWLPEYLEEQLNVLEEKNYDLIYCDALFFGDLPDSYKTFMEKNPSLGAVTAENLIGVNSHIITSGTIASRRKVVESGLFDEKLPRIGMEDFDLWFRLAKNNLRIGFQERVLLKYRVRPNSLSGSNVQRAEREIKALEILREKYSLTDAEYEASENHYRMAIAELEVEKGKFNLTQGNYAEARENFRKANEYYQKFKYSLLQTVLTINPKLVVKLFKKLRPREFSFIAPDGDGSF